MDITDGSYDGDREGLVVGLLVGEAVKNSVGRNDDFIVGADG